MLYRLTTLLLLPLHLPTLYLLLPTTLPLVLPRPPMLQGWLLLLVSRLERTLRELVIVTVLLTVLTIRCCNVGYVLTTYSGADGKPIKIPCACPPPQAQYIAALQANVAAGHAINKSV
jgi:hypothetical protein